MAQTREGAIKVAADRVGLTIGQYKVKLALGLKWCFGCRRWHKHEQFATDRSRWDERVACCKNSINKPARSSYVPKPRPPKGRSFVPARDGDKKQARRRINFFVESGIIPNPNDLLCLDCGHIGQDFRHEYDHHLGYAAKHHEHVQVLCSECHHEREETRRGRQN